MFTVLGLIAYSLVIVSMTGATLTSDEVYELYVYKREISLGVRSCKCSVFAPCQEPVSTLKYLRGVIQESSILCTGSSGEDCFTTDANLYFAGLFYCAGDNLNWYTHEAHLKAAIESRTLAPTTTTTTTTGITTTTTTTKTKAETTASKVAVASGEIKVESDSKALQSGVLIGTVVPIACLIFIATAYAIGKKCTQRNDVISESLGYPPVIYEEIPGNGYLQTYPTLDPIYNLADSEQAQQTYDNVTEDGQQHDEPSDA